MCLTAWHHEPWTDEAQAWILARDTSLVELFTERLRYEGSPGLWHAILFLPAHLGMPYPVTLLAIGVVAALSGVFLFFRYSPLPVWMTILSVFSYYCAYQYAVVARSYCLLLALLVSAAVLRRQCWRRPWLFTLVLILLAHVSLHGCIFAASFWLDARWRQTTELPAPGRAMRWKLVACTGAIAATFAFIAWMLIPPPDLVTSAGGAFLESSIFVPRMIWIFLQVFGGDNLGLAMYVAVSIAALLSITWLARSPSPFFIAAFVGIWLFLGLVTSSRWHIGLLFYAWLFSLWMLAERRSPAHHLRLRKASMWAVGGILGLQAFFAFQTSILEWRLPYSGADAAARYLSARNPAPMQWAAYGFHAWSLQPYANSNVPVNYAVVAGGKSYWIWSDANHLNDPIRGTQFDAERPEIVVLGVSRTLKSTRLTYRHNDRVLRTAGYVVERQFVGGLLDKGRVTEEETIVIYRRNDVPLPMSASSSLLPDS